MHLWGKLRRVQAKRDLLAGELNVLPNGYWSIDGADVGLESVLEDSLADFLAEKELHHLVLNSDEYSPTFKQNIVNHAHANSESISESVAEIEAASHVPQLLVQTAWRA